MKKLILTLCCALVAAQASATDLTRQIQAIVDTTFAAHPAMVGVMVSVVGPGVDGMYSYAMGVSDREKHTQLTPQNPVLLASNTKTFVAAAIMKLHSQGKLNIEDGAGRYLTTRSYELLTQRGYNLDAIKLRHLLSHTSGIADYVTDAYWDEVKKHPNRRWTRDEQIELAVDAGKKLAAPGDTFAYADVNYLLLTEVLEKITGKPFYKAIRDMDHPAGKNYYPSTWFATLEEKPAGSAPLAHQYYSKFGWDSHNLDPSWDLYGGGGMAATPADLAQFFYDLFTGAIIKDTATVALMHTTLPYKAKTNYCLGVRKLVIDGHTGYYHGGWWGTDVIYFPDLDAAISVVILERAEKDASAAICRAIVAAMTSEQKGKN